MKKNKSFGFLFILLFSFALNSYAQFVWTKKPLVIHHFNEGKLMEIDLKSNKQTVVLDMSAVPGFKYSSHSYDEKEENILVFGDATKVWRYNDRGNYFVYNIATKKVRPIGVGLKPSSMSFAKFSPDGTKVAFLYEYNLYVQEIETGKRTQLTTNGSRRQLYGAFDWVYQEEFGCRDGFRWSDDSKKIAFWYFDVSPTKDYLMLNTLDSIYPSVVPVEFPVAGDRPSTYKIGVVELESMKTSWIEWKEDPLGSYIPNMEWTGNNELITVRMDRRQQQLWVDLVNTQTKEKKTIYTETSDTWIDPQPNKAFWNWIDNKQSYLWLTEKDGWRQIWKFSKDASTKTLLTDVNYDVIAMDRIDETNGYVYFYASPYTSYQRYLFRAKLDGTGVEQVTSYEFPGYHRYLISREDGIAFWMPSNYLDEYEPNYVFLDEEVKKAAQGPKQPKKYEKSNIEFFQVEIESGVFMDGMMQFPKNFDPSKKYPVLFYVYTEPGAQTVLDMSGAMGDFMYNGNMAEDGYVIITMDNRGTPAPKGTQWRKAIYKKIGQINIDDQAKAAKKILERPYLDNNRVGVWGWSGGGTATLNLLFRYPEIYKMGIAIAALTDLRLYDNIYTERYMGLPSDNKDDYTKGSAVTHVKGLKGKLLYIHGTNDDNVHINNADMLIDALVREGKEFQMMYYPGRSHSIDEREGTSEHLRMLFTKFIKENL